MFSINKKLDSKRLSKSLLLALSFSAFMVLVLKLSERAVTAEQPQLVIRTIDVALPLPPPPPPPVQQPQQNNAALDLDFSGNAQAMAISFSHAKAKTDLKIDPPPQNLLTSPQWNLDWKQDWQTFGLGQLDRAPKLISPIHIDFPNSLADRGVHQAIAKLHVLINTQGQVLLKGINHLQYPELKAGLTRALQTARFTVPKKSGLAVNAEFIWTLEIEHS